MKIRALVVEPFPGLPDGELTVKNFAVDDVVDGDLARVAIEEGWAIEMDEDGEEPERDPPPVVKRSAPKGRKAAASEGL